METVINDTINRIVKRVKMSLEKKVNEHFMDLKNEIDNSISLNDTIAKKTNSESLQPLLTYAEKLLQKRAGDKINLTDAKNRIKEEVGKNVGSELTRIVENTVSKTIENNFGKSK